MAGNKNSGRRGGNPELKKDGKLGQYLYKPKGDKPLSKVITIRLSEELYDKIRRELPSKEWQDQFREKLEEIYGVQE